MLMRPLKALWSTNATFSNIEGKQAVLQVRLGQDMHVRLGKNMQVMLGQDMHADQTGARHARRSACGKTFRLGKALMQVMQEQVVLVQYRRWGWCSAAGGAGAVPQVTLVQYPKPGGCSIPHVTLVIQVRLVRTCRACML